MSNDLNIQIPESHYAGFQKRSRGRGPDDDPYVIGFITPHEDNAAGRKRTDTVDRWRDNKIPAKTMPNELMSGFKISNVNKGYKDKNDTWRIVDPRGFELEIYSGNLSEILSNNTVENGEIICKCIWGRSQGINFLLSENSEVYQNAMKNTARMNKKISLRDVKPGNTVVLKNGTVGVYMGALHLITTKDQYPDDDDYQQFSRGKILDISKKKKHFFVVESDSHSWRSKKDKYIITAASPKISEIKDTSTKTIEECEAELGRMAKELYEFVDGSESSMWDFVGVVANSDVKFQYKLEPINIDVYVETDKERYDRSTLVVESKSGLMGTTSKSNLLDYGNNWKNGGDVRAPQIDVERLKQNIALTYIMEESGYGYRRGRNYNYRELTGNKDDFKWYSLKVCFANPKTSNEFELTIGN